MAVKSFAADWVCLHFSHLRRCALHCFIVCLWSRTLEERPTLWGLIFERVWKAENEVVEELGWPTALDCSSAKRLPGFSLAAGPKVSICIDRWWHRDALGLPHIHYIIRLIITNKLMVDHGRPTFTTWIHGHEHEFDFFFHYKSNESQWIPIQPYQSHIFWDYFLVLIMIGGEWSSNDNLSNPQQPIHSLHILIPYDPILIP